MIGGKPPLYGEIWYVICRVKNGDDGLLGLAHFDFSSREQAIDWCKRRPENCEIYIPSYTPIAITSKTTWTEGDGMELLA